MDDDHENWVRRYVRSSRRLDQSATYYVHVVQDPNHRSVLHTFSEYVSHKLLWEAKIVPIYSLQRKHCVARVGGATAIVMDAGLTELLMAMNALYFSNTPAHRFQHLISGYIAQQFHILGEHAVALHFLIERDRRELISRDLGTGMSIEELSYIAVQETYAIFHEASHLMLQEDEDYFNNHLNILLKQLMTSFGESVRPPDNFFQDFEKISTSRQIQEEFLADDMARVQTLLTRANHWPATPEGLFEAIYLAHLHLCAIEFVDVYINFFLDDPHRFSTQHSSLPPQMQENLTIQFIRQSFSGIDLTSHWAARSRVNGGSPPEEISTRLFEMEKRHRSVFIGDIAEWFGMSLHNCVPLHSRSQFCGGSVTDSDDPERLRNEYPEWPDLLIY